MRGINIALFRTGFNLDVMPDAGHKMLDAFEWHEDVGVPKGRQAFDFHATTQ
jgi:hypothetical protein